MGFGTRGYEFAGFDGAMQGDLPLFYRRYPTWSVLGKLVHDALAAVDLATATSQRAPDKPIGLPAFDTHNVFAVGYDVGGRTALYAAAVDPARRLAGVVSINGWTPMRTDTNTSATGGIQRLWSWHGMQPQLGLFDGRETELPYDMEDVLLEASGPDGDTPILVFQHDLDRMNDAQGVAATVASAVKGGANVTLETAPTVNMLNDHVHDVVIQWLQRQVKGH